MPQSAPAQSPPSTDPFLSARDVTVVLDGTQILDAASLEVMEGEIHVLIGPNGAGKTTFANAITGHVPTTAGDIRLGAGALQGDVYARVRRGIGRKFQVPRVFPRLTSAQNLEVARRSPGAGAATDDGAVVVRDVEAESLSHGERQHLELAMVMSRRPAIAVLDEPTAGMTRGERVELAQAIRAAAGRETFLIVEHDMDFVESVADRVSFMQEGRVIATGSFAEIAEDPVVRAAYLGTATSDFTPAATADDARDDASHGALTVRGLGVLRGSLAAVRDVSLDLPAGGALGVLGRNGAGKTTLLCGLMGLLRTTGGVVVDGEPVHHRPAWWRAQHGIALVPQGRQLFGGLTVAENLRAAELGPCGHGRPFDVHELFPALQGLMGRRAGLLSGGEQQQVAIARALLRRPTVLLLDEPTEGLSPVVVREIRGVLEHLVRRGLTIVLAEQHRALVEDLCSSFLVLRSGEAIGGGPIVAGAIDAYYQTL